MARAYSQVRGFDHDAAVKRYVESTDSFVKVAEKFDTTGVSVWKAWVKAGRPVKKARRVGRSYAFVDEMEDA